MPFKLTKTSIVLLLILLLVFGFLFTNKSLYQEGLENSGFEEVSY